MSSPNVDLRYVKNKEIYLSHAYSVLTSQFANEQVFESYYSNINSDVHKNAFLRIASFYRFLVKDGYWHVQIEDSDSDLPFITSTYKLVAIFGLIESISEEKFVEFDQWLYKKNETQVYPINSMSDFSKLYAEYKSNHGSIRKCIQFFQNLSPERQKVLCNSILVQNVPKQSIEDVAKFLYRLRSSFVHEGEFALELMPGSFLRVKGEIITETRINIGDITSLFEEGLINWFHQVA